MRPSYLYDGIPIPGKTTSLYWDGAQVSYKVNVIAADSDWRNQGISSYIHFSEEWVFMIAIIKLARTCCPQCTVCKHLLLSASQCWEADLLVTTANLTKLPVAVVVITKVLMALSKGMKSHARSCGQEWLPVMSCRIFVSQNYSKDILLIVALCRKQDVKMFVFTQTEQTTKRSS